MKRERKIAAIVIASILGVIILVGAISLVAIVSSDDFVQFDSSKLSTARYCVVLLDDKDEVIEQKLLINNVKHIDVNCLSEHTKNAFISIEDKRFYSHNGIDTIGILRAIKCNLKSLSFKQGASTITQQLVKNTHLNNDKTIKRKINEMILAKRLEKEYSKDEILQMYLNTIYFGGSAYGIEVASNLYFNKSASSLTLSQSAMLAGIIQSPNNYSPYNDIEKCINRRNTVLSLMLSRDLINDSQFEEAINETISHTPVSSIKHQDYCDAVIVQACQILGISPMQLAKGNYTIRTYYQPHAQQEIIHAINQDKTLTTDNRSPQKTALLIDNQSCGINAYYCKNAYDFLGQKRQIGSTAKTFAVYAPALDIDAITLATPILDEKTNYNGYIPNNFNDKYQGWITTKKAFSTSSNVCATNILNSIGIAKSREYLSKLGFEVSENDNNLTMALGNLNKGADIITLTSAYSTLARDGQRCIASLIKSIEYNGNTVFEHQPSAERVYSQSTSFLTTCLLLSAVKEGTAQKLSTLPYQVACKTGTVGTPNNNSDAISVGYTSAHTFCVWLSDNNSLLDVSVTGGSAPTRVAKQLLGNIYYNQQPADFVKPNNVSLYRVDKESLSTKHIVALAPQSNEYFSEYFVNHNAPIKVNKKVNATHISASMLEDSIKIVLPANAQYYRLYRMYNDDSILICDDCSLLNGVYIDRNTTAGASYTYFLTRLIDGKEQLSSNKVSVATPLKPTNEQNNIEQREWWRSFIQSLTD